MSVDIQALATRPGDVVYVREDGVGLAERVEVTKARVMADQTVAIVRGPADEDAEAMATFVIDEAGRLIKDRRGESSPLAPGRAPVPS